MTYDQLVAFTSVAAEGTFTGASDALHKSQPAVSKLIRNLEGELGVVLFDRTRYRATLTDAGSVFYERAAAVVESTHALRGFGFALGGKVEAIARTDHPVATRRPPIPPTLLRAHPQIVLRDSAQGSSRPALNVLEGGLRWTVTDIGAKKELILAGMGWGGLPEHLVARELADGTLKALVIPEFAEAMDLFAIRRRDRVHGVVATALWEALGSAGAKPAPSRARRRGRTRTHR